MKQKFDTVDLAHHAAFHSSSKGKKNHPAIDYFRQLQEQPFTPQLEAFLSRFADSKLIDYDHFVEGVKRFIELANANPLGMAVNRKAIYGTIYSGLHYNNDLVQLWNAQHVSEEPIKASEVMTLTPSGWDATLQDGSITLIYKGQQPAQALDALVKGPTVIDCGMFTQLSLWFGIRFMLGNERFNQCFGRAPFFITQLVFNRIEESSEPFSGNPLYSFLAQKDKAAIPSVTMRHLANTPLYPLKHPGGNDGGQNCIVIGSHYYIFAPLLESTQGMTEATVLNLLRDSFNDDRKFYDLDRLSLYATTPETCHPRFLLTYSQLIEAADALRHKTFTEEEFSKVKQSPELEFTFDLEQFSLWLQRVENTPQPDSIDYLPQAIDYSLMPTELLDVIPFENRISMDFSKFKQESSQQKELLIMSQQFCQSIMANEAKLIILTGKAGVGKTASAVCAAKELTARGKKVAWISEVMVKGWAEQAKSMADLDHCRLAIDTLLDTEPDVVFLDDDNLAGFSGNLLLEKIYSWFVSHPGKGLFITSNEPIRFENCYGYKLDGKYHFPPFNDYRSPQYLNWQHKSDLAGVSLRTKRDGQSIGAIVSDDYWETHKSNLGEIELIPAFDEKEELAPIRRSLRETGLLHCSAYEKLRPLQKRWISVHEAGGNYESSNGASYYEAPCLTANPSIFEKTAYKTIALEIRAYNNSFCGEEICSNSMYQLIRVLNYAHDQGGRRVILINQTRYSAEELLNKIKAQLPPSESERTWSRLVLLLCETQDSIFSYGQFNGQIEVTSPTQWLSQKHGHGVADVSMFNRRGRCPTLQMDTGRLLDPVSHLNHFFDENDSIFEATLRLNAVAKKSSPIERETFTTHRRNPKSALLMKHRQDDSALQHDHNKRFG